MEPGRSVEHILVGEAPKWQARDDVYQVGQLLAMLIRGDARSRVRTRDVRGLRCSDHLKEIVYRCIGERRKRYESADELVEALRNPPAPLTTRTALRSLKGVQRGRARRQARRRHRPWRAVGEDDGRGQRAAQRVAGCGP